MADQPTNPEQPLQTAAKATETAVHAGAQATAQTAQAGAAAARSASNAGRAAMQNAADTGTAMMNEFTRMMGEMKLPAMPDMAALMEAHRRNLETLSAANRVAVEGAQAVARRHMEILQQTMGELSETMRSLASPEAPQEKAARQAAMLKQSYERAVANMKELSDLIQRANGEALGLLNSRFTEALDEVQTLMRKAKPM